MDGMAGRRDGPLDLEGGVCAGAGWMTARSPHRANGFGHPERLLVTLLVLHGKDRGS